MSKEYFKESLIFICNLAIPPNDLMETGLGDLINFDEYSKEEISPSLFVSKNELVLHVISKFMEEKKLTYEQLVKKMFIELEFNQVSLFLEEFRLFALKNYFSNKLVLEKIKPLEKKDKSLLEDALKDQIILNRLKNYDQ